MAVTPGNAQRMDTSIGNDNDNDNAVLRSTFAIIFQH